MRRMTFILAATTLMTACGGDEVTHSTFSSRDFAKAERMFSDLFEVMDEVARDSDGIRTLDCVESIEIDTLASPMTMTIDFGNGDCEGADGLSRSGKLHCTFTGRYSEAGTTVTIAPEDYRVDNYLLAGFVQVEVLGENAEGERRYALEISGGVMTNPSGAWLMGWECTEERTLIAGGQSDLWADDVYEISGSGQGVNREGGEFKVIIQEALRMEVLCPWVVSGRLDIAPEGLSVRQLDFGDGGCNSTATLYVDDSEYTISQ